MPILNALQMQNQCNLNVHSKCILNGLKIRKGDNFNVDFIKNFPTEAD